MDNQINKNLMKNASVVALSLFIFGLLSLQPITVQAQSSEDPFGDFEDLFSELEDFESESSDEIEAVEDESSAEDEASAENLQSSDEEAVDSETTSDEETAPVESKTNPLEARLNTVAEIPEGKEDYLLYNVPGAIEHGGMTLLRIDSPKFFNKYQKCNFATNEQVTGTLAMLKISQGAPLECREDMQYQFAPYKTFRSTR